MQIIERGCSSLARLSLTGWQLLLLFFLLLLLNINCRRVTKLCAFYYFSLMFSTVATTRISCGHKLLYASHRLYLSIYSISLGWVAVTWGISAHNFISKTHTATHTWLERGSWQPAASRWPAQIFWSPPWGNVFAASAAGKHTASYVCEVSAYKAMLGIRFVAEWKKNKWANK